jgi:RHS repeat-associated protein
VEKDIDLNDTNPFRYCAEYFDNETGNIYLRNRYYSPNSQRFLTQDPINSGTNWYSFVDNNPINYTDSLGLDKALDDYINENYSEKPTITIAIKRPVANSREVGYITSDGELDNGHSFLRLDDGNGSIQYIGLGPAVKSLTDMLLSNDIAGKFVDDEKTVWNVAKVFTLTPSQYENYNDKINSFKENVPNYNIETYNCTTWAVDTIMQGFFSPVFLNISKRGWTLPSNIAEQLDKYAANKYPAWLSATAVVTLMNGNYGYTPADAAQDLKSAQGTVLLQYGQGLKTITNNLYISSGN